eukprot:110372_1
MFPFSQLVIKNRFAHVTMPLTRLQFKLQQLEQFTFTPSTSTTNSNEKKRQRITKQETDNLQPNKRRKLNIKNTNQKTKPKSTKKISIKYEINEQKDSFESIANSNIPLQIQKSPFIALTPDIINEGNRNSAPLHWEHIYNGIYNMRKNGIATNAEVDTMGAASLFDKSADLKTQRFHVLVSLLLSSQTKDSVTAEAVYNLRKHFNGLSIDAICNVKKMEDIDSCICKVGFHNKKTKYLFKTANILKKEYNNDCPNTIKDLCKLPGIGPKMAYIAMQIMWGQNVGIGIDTHCHRIMNLLGWTRGKKCKTAEHTRKEIQEWIPKELWPGINRMFVGFGQRVCKPRNPKCDICVIKQFCPIGRKLVRNKKT